MPSGRDAALNAAIAGLPQDASIGTYDEIYAHLGFFPHAGLGVDAAPEYVLFDDRYSATLWDRHVRPEIAVLRANGIYHTLANTDGIVLLRRLAP
jgi:hypothetical protein